MNFDNREGIARFGMGMKTAALSMSPVFELYTWQEPRAFYSMVLDVEEIGKDRSNLVQLPDPTLLSELPDEVMDFFRRPMTWPDPQDQELFALNSESVPKRLGTSGTIAYMPQCSWGIEAGLDAILTSAATPADIPTIVATAERRERHRARLRRTFSKALWPVVDQPAAIEARAELGQIQRLLSPADWQLISAVGSGMDYKSLAISGATPGGLRIRVMRIHKRLSLAA